MNCRYMCQSLLEWILNNKIIVFLGLLSFCLFVSTLALAGQRNRLSSELDECRASATTDATTTNDGITAQPEASSAQTEASSAQPEVSSAQPEVSSAQPEVSSNPSEASSPSSEAPATQAVVIESALERENGGVHEVSEDEEQSNSVRDALRGYGLLTKLIAS